MQRSLRLLVLTLTSLCALTGKVQRLGAQQLSPPRDSSAARLSQAALAAQEVYNEPATRRTNGALNVPAASVVEGNVAVLNGPVTIAGQIHGTLVAINADVHLAAGARIDRRLVIVGGIVTGADSAVVEGATLRQAELLRYHFDGARLVAEPDAAYDSTWWERHHVLNDLRHGEAKTDFFYLASRAYNRVEGWSFVAGPRLERFTSWGSFNVHAFGVVRTASPIQWGAPTLGHDAGAEVQFGKPLAVAVGARAFDVVEPTENWQLADGEVGLSSVVLHRDYRDYYGRHGGEGYVRLQRGKDADLTFALSNEQWNDVRQRDPWTLFRNGESWRPNPFMDAGNMHLFSTTLRVDTRELNGSPWAGWYLTANVEAGAGQLARFGSPQNVDPSTGALLPVSAEPVHYTRGMLDLRRYNRLTSYMSLNLRLVTGGWLGGDALPTERKLSIGGPGTLPGYGFRDADPAPDVLQCSEGIVQAGTPGQCDRIAMLQLELRTRLWAGALRDDASDEWWRPGLNGRMEWVLFADMGRGWLVGPQDGGTSFPSGLFPTISSYKTDVGVGIDFGGVGAYVAKALSDRDEPFRFIVRLVRRF